MTEHSSASFAKGLFLGEIHEDMVFPYPRFGPDERARVEQIAKRFHDWADESYDQYEVESAGRLPEGTWRELGELGVLGLYVDEEYGGQGLTHTGYSKVFEHIQVAASTLAVVLGVHQSIGFKGIVMYGSAEQKERFLPDLIAGRQRAGFALTEPNAGSDAYHIETTATLQPDGSYVLNGEKRWIGNGSGEVLTTFARTPQGGHVANLRQLPVDGWAKVFAVHKVQSGSLDGNILYRKCARWALGALLGHTHVFRARAFALHGEQADDSEPPELHRCSYDLPFSFSVFRRMRSSVDSA